MFHLRLRTCSARIGGAALAAVVAVGMATEPVERPQFRVDTRQVQLTAAILGAVQNTTLVASESPAANSPITPAAALAEVPTLRDETAPAVPAAATGESFLDTPLGTALIAANFLILPLWFLATPITLPLSMLVAASQVTMDGVFGTLQFLISTSLGFLLGPLGLLAPFVSSSASAAAAAELASVRSRRTEGILSDTLAAAAAPSAAIEDVNPVAIESVPTIKQGRGRIVKRQSGQGLRAAAAAISAGTNATHARVDGKSTLVLNGRQAPKSHAIETKVARSNAMESSEPKSTVKARSRR